MDFDRAAHLRKDLDALEALLGKAETRLVPVWRAQCIVQGARLAMPRIADAANLLDRGELVWLGMLDGEGCFAVDISTADEPLQHRALSEQSQLADLRLAGATLPAGQADLAAYARAILHWHSHHAFCARCGSPSSPRHGGHQRVCNDEACATEHFPRTDPAVLVLVSDEDRCLLGRQSTWPRGMYSALAGFVEPGETLEHAVAREVREETGVEIDDIRYQRSQPWPFPASLMVGFTAVAASTHIVLDDELQDARWFSREKIAAPDGFFVPPPFSLAGQLIARFLGSP